MGHNLPTATSTVLLLLHEIHSGCHLQHENHPPVATESEMSRRNLLPGAMKARTLASGAPSETTHSLQFPTHTFNLPDLMQMLWVQKNSSTLILSTNFHLYAKQALYLAFFMPSLSCEQLTTVEWKVVALPISYVSTDKSNSQCITGNAESEAD